MSKYLKLFETTSDYEAYINGGGVVLPNVSVAKDAPKMVYFNPMPPFVKLSLNNGEVVELQGSGELTKAMITPYKKSVVSAEIGKSCTSIGQEAFFYCDGLTSITIPDSVTNIGQDAFYQCDGLTSIDIPNSVTTIGKSAFERCKGLTTITIPDSVTSIGDSVFYVCKGLTSIGGVGSGASVEIPSSVTSIGRFAFGSCSGLTSITIPSSVTSIGESAFVSCSGLTNVTIPDSVTRINDQTFYECTGLTSITIGSGVTYIGGRVFEGCTGLTSVTIGSGVTSISYNAFGGCSGLTSITCNAITAPTISNYTFKNVKTNGTLTVPINSTGYDTWMGTGDYYLGKYGWTMVEPFFAKLSLNNGEVVELQGSGELTSAMVSRYKSSLVSAEIGELCTSIGANAFDSCRGLTSITIGSGVTSIGDYAFSYCTDLTSVTIPSSVTSIGNNAFYWCSNLKNITSLATTAPTIKSDTFYNVKTGGTLTVPIGSTGYDVWMGTVYSYLGYRGWTKVEQ